MWCQAEREKEGERERERENAAIFFSTLTVSDKVACIYSCPAGGAVDTESCHIAQLLNIHLKFINYFSPQQVKHLSILKSNSVTQRVISGQTPPLPFDLTFALGLCCLLMISVVVV